MVYRELKEKMEKIIEAVRLDGSFGDETFVSKGHDFPDQLAEALATYIQSYFIDPNELKK